MLINLIKEVTDAVLSNGETAYFPQNVAQLARESKSKAVKNADSYTWFATAMYLDQCDWSRQICAQSTSTSTIAARSDNQTSTDMSLTRRPNRRKLLHHLWTGSERVCSEKRLLKWMRERRSEEVLKNCHGVTDAMI